MRNKKLFFLCKDIFGFHLYICCRSLHFIHVWYVTVFYLFCYCFPCERVLYYLLETSVILFCYCCFLVLSALWFLSLLVTYLNVGHLVLFLLFYLSLDCYYHCFVGLFCSPHQVSLPCFFLLFSIFKVSLCTVLRSLCVLCLCLLDPPLPT